MDLRSFIENRQKRHQQGCFDHTIDANLQVRWLRDFEMDGCITLIGNVESFTLFCPGIVGILSQIGRGFIQVLGNQQHLMMLLCQQRVILYSLQNLCRLQETFLQNEFISLINDIVVGQVGFVG